MSASEYKKPERQAYDHMIHRCTNPRDARWPHYGGRGITVCDRWRTSYSAFLEDMGSRPSSKHSIDRINNNGNYEPGNCRWATYREQNNNRRDNTLLHFNGKSQTVAQWAREVDMNPGTLISRLTKRGWTTERALTTPPNTSALWTADPGMKVCHGKQCQLAGIQQPLTAFHINRNSADGRRNACKHCRSVRATRPENLKRRGSNYESRSMEHGPQH